MLKTKSSKEVSRIGLAGYQGRPIKDEEFSDILKQRGDINLLEITELNGFTPRLVGNHLKNLLREDIFLITSTKKRTGPTLAAELDNVLKDLGTDYIDMIKFINIKKGYDYLSLVEEDGALAEALELKNQGKIRYIGASTKDLEIAQELKNIRAIDRLVLAYNPSEAYKEKTYKEFAEDISIISTLPLAGRAIDDLKGLIDFSLEKSFFENTIFRIKNSQEVSLIRDLISNHQPLSPDKCSDLLQSFKDIGDNYCRQCGLCMPCAVGMDILKNLEFNKKALEGDFSFIEDYQALEKNASNCIRCGACELRCPFGVQVRAKHKETVKLIEEYENANKKK